MLPSEIIAAVPTSAIDLAPLAPTGGIGAVLGVAFLIVQQYRKGRAEAVETERKRSKELEEKVELLGRQIAALDVTVEEAREEIREVTRSHHRELLEREDRYNAERTERDLAHSKALDEASKRLMRESRVVWMLRELLTTNGIEIPDLDPDKVTPKLPEEK